MCISGFIRGLVNFSLLSILPLCYCLKAVRKCHTDDFLNLHLACEYSKVDKGDI